MLSFSGKTLRYNHLETTFLHEIRDAVETPFGALVLVNGAIDRNIFLVASSGEVRWQVAKLRDDGLIKDGEQSYTSVAFQEGKIKAFNAMCFSCELDPSDGSIVDAIFTR